MQMAQWGAWNILIKLGLVFHKIKSKILPNPPFSKEGAIFGFAKIEKAPPFAKGGWEGF
jgi:hypothetical protein